jgi:hypothetical protein
VCVASQVERSRRDQFEAGAFQLYPRPSRAHLPWTRPTPPLTLSQACTAGHMSVLVDPRSNKSNYTGFNAKDCISKTKVETQQQAPALPPRNSAFAPTSSLLLRPPPLSSPHHRSG